MPFNKLDETIAGKIRPRFKLESPASKEKLMTLISEHSKQDTTIIHNTHDRFIKLSVPAKDQHYWSPVVSLSFEQEDNRTLVRGVIGPKENIWTMFMFFYIGISVLGFFATMFSLVKLQTSGSTAYLFLIPIFLIILSTIFLTSRYGKVQAHSQTIHLLRSLRASVDDIECVRVEE
jgi:hypothetical protein